jgi:T-complex protein 1 subunit theta
MLKDGHKSFEGVDDAILRNIDAAKQLADIIKTSLGPNGEQGKAIYAPCLL